MKAFAFDHYGSPDVFYERDIEKKTLKENQVRIEIIAFGVTPYDTYLRLGNMQKFRSLTFPAIIGSDLSGIILEVGAKVKDLAVGDEVVAVVPLDAYSEEIVTTAQHVVKKPLSVPFTRAAALPTAGIAAYNLFFHMIKESQGQTLFIAGATGSVGSLLLQLALKNNFQVFASGHSKKIAQVTSLGLLAENYFPYDQEVTIPLQVDIFVDATKGSHGISLGLKALKETGTYIALNSLPSENQKAQLPEVNFLTLGHKKDWSDQAALRELLAWMGQNQLRLALDEVLPFSLENLKKAHKKIEAAKNQGRLVLAK